MFGEMGKRKRQGNRESVFFFFLPMCGWNLRAYLAEMIEENIDSKDYPTFFKIIIIYYFIK